MLCLGPILWDSGISPDVTQVVMRAFFKIALVRVVCSVSIANVMQSSGVIHVVDTVVS